MPSDHYERRLEEVAGWFAPVDQVVFECLLSWQSRTQPAGDAVELGVFEGKSAIHIARFLRPGERLTVCDLFDDAATQEEVHPAARHFYRTLAQSTFEKNFLQFHHDLPHIVRGLTSTIGEHVAPGTCRFVHIDASHQYEHVREDTAAARTMLRPDGIASFDDYRTEHTLGTAAAVWEAVLNEGLHPICASASKLYGTWGDPEPAQAELARFLSARRGIWHEVQYLGGGRQVVRVVEVLSRSDRLRRRGRERLSDARRSARRALGRVRTHLS